MLLLEEWDINLKARSSLRYKIWLYLIVFSLSILILLWLFQVIFLNGYYKWYKTRELIGTAQDILESYSDDNYETMLDDIAHRDSACIELVKNNKLIYVSSLYNKGCMVDGGYRHDFIESNDSSSRYILKNSRFNNDTLILAFKLNKNTHLFVSASLEPIDATVTILRSQLFYITLIVILLSLLVSYFISRVISSPIIKMKNKAIELAKGNYNITFENSDIDEINELSRSLNYACNELEKTEDLRRELLANVSHDLKTPLTMIKAYAELIRDVTHDDAFKMNKNLNVIIDETDRLNVLVNDILELSKIRSNTAPLEISSFDLNELIKTIIDRYQIYVENENYDILYKEHPGLIIRADRKRIEQVLYNLVNNAINYTGDDKKVIINVKEDKKCIRVEVKDTGKGIEKKDLEYIWDKYYKVDKTHRREQKGSGIGLSIVKNILISHNFEYGVETKINKGTTFYFVISKND